MEDNAEDNVHNDLPNACAEIPSASADIKAQVSVEDVDSGLDNVHNDLPNACAEIPSPSADIKAQVSVEDVDSGLDNVHNDLPNACAEIPSPSADIKAQVSVENVASGLEDVNPIALCQDTMNTNVENAKPFKCNLCKSSFSKGYALSNHKKLDIVPGY